MNTNTVIFTFSKELAESGPGEPMDYYVDVDEETLQINVYVDDVTDELISSHNDAELCEFFGLDSEYLVSCNRSDFL